MASMRFSLIACSLMYFAATGSPLQPSFKVIFRLDDVHDYFMAPQLQGIIDAFLQKKQRLCMGIIGGRFFGQDTMLVQKVKRALNHGSEAFNHGDDATTTFGHISKENAKKHILAAENTGFVYSTFVPNENIWSQALIEALQELKYTVVSAGEGGDGMTPDLISPLKRMPNGAQLAFPKSCGEGEKCDGDNWVTTIHGVVSACQAQFASVPVCVVMMHPQEFYYGIVTIKMLEKLIDDILQQGWSITTFRDVAKSLSPSMPLTAQQAVMSR